MEPIRIMQKDLLTAKVYGNRDDLGAAAARECADTMRELLRGQEELHMIFAAAPSQNEFLAHLIREDVDWSRVVGFHMDEYVGCPADSPFGFARFLRNAVFDRVPFRRVECLNIAARDMDEEAERYAALLRQTPPDIVCMGIGENGHVAFNDPGVADFSDPKLVKRAELDEKCRLQQVADGCFPTLSHVPRYALTLTVPALMRAGYAFCMVPGSRKAAAVAHTLRWDIGEACPATALRRHPRAVLYLDADSARELA